MLTAVAVAAAALVGVAAAGAQPAGAAPPPCPAVAARQAGHLTVLPAADLLMRHCDGTPIGGPTAAAVGSTAAWTGNCTLVLAAPGGKLTWLPAAAAAIDGALVIRLADGAPPTPPAGGGDTGGGGGAVEWHSLSAVRATSLRVLPAASVSGAGDVRMRAGENATLIGASLSSGGVLTVTARRCLASAVTSSAPTVRVCEEVVGWREVGEGMIGVRRDERGP